MEDICISLCIFGLVISEYCSGHPFKSKFIGPIVDSYGCQSAEKVTDFKTLK